MKQTFYFSHDYNTQQDEKIQKLFMRRQWEGYGIFWGLIESLYQNDGYLEFDCERIAYLMRTDSKTIEDVILNYDLFEIIENKFTSRSVLRRLEERNVKKSKAQKSAEARWNKGHANALRPHDKRNAIKERKGKESKVNEKEIESEKENDGEKILLPTPRETFLKFIKDVSEKNEEFEKLVHAVSIRTGNSSSEISAEVDKFVSYWTEKTPDGKKERWQKQEVFEVKRRLATWFKNFTEAKGKNNKFGQKLRGGTIIS